MFSIRYMHEKDIDVPSDDKTSKLAKLTCALAKAVASETGEHNPENVLNKAKDMLNNETFTQSPQNLDELSARLPAVELAADMLQFLDTDYEFHVEIAWGPRVTFGKTTIKASNFLDLLARYGYKGINVPLMHLVSSASLYDKDGNTYTDDSVLLAMLSSYYASFDERFSALFYPNYYSAFMSSDDALFGAASAMTSHLHDMHMTQLTADGAYIGAMIRSGKPINGVATDALNEHTRIPSMLYEFYKRTGRRVIVDGTARESINVQALLPDENKPLSEQIDDYKIEQLPTNINVPGITTTKTIEHIVMDAACDGHPASMPEVIAEMMLNQSFSSESEFGDWLSYTERANERYKQRLESSNSSSAPKTVIVESGAREWLLNLGLANEKSSFSAMRIAIGLAAYCTYRVGCIAGGAPDDIEIGFDELALASEVTKAFPSPYDVGELDADDTELINDIIESRDLSCFDMPNEYRKMFAASMNIRGGSTIKARDLYDFLKSDQERLPQLIKAISDADDTCMMTKVDDESAEILSTASLIYRRLIQEIPTSTQGEIATLYATSIAIPVQRTLTKPSEPICSVIDSWIASAAVESFDTREIGMSWDEQQRLQKIVEIDTQKSFPGGQQTGTGIPDPTLHAKHAKRGAHGYIDKFCVDMVKQAERGEIGVGIVGRDAEIKLVETILSRKDKSNPLLLGAAGVGKTAIVEAVASRIASGETAALDGMGLASLDISSLIGDGGIPAMTEHLEGVLSEAIATNTILFIDEIHQLPSVGNGELNAANIMKPYMARGGLKLIGATTEREYNYTIAKDRALSRRFSTIHLPSLSFDAIVDVLNEKARLYADYHGVKINSGIAQTTALIAEDYMAARESPDRELDIIDTASALASNDESETVDEKHIIDAVKLLTSNNAVKTRREIAQEIVHNDLDNATLDDMFPRVAGQYSAKKAIANRIMESKLGLSAGDRPRNVFMFVGESGVGKTYMATEMAPLLDATCKDVLSISLGEFQDKASATRLVGASPQYVGYQEGGLLTNFAKAHPSGIVILDELDKCTSEITQLFLGVFDTGILRAADGSICDCRSMTFVCTANIGTSKRNKIGFTNESDNEAEKADREHVIAELKEQFGSPLVNRLDEIVRFDKLTDNDLAEASRISYRELAKKIANRYGVNIEQEYSEDNAANDTLKILADEGDSVHDARSAWNRIEKNIMSSALTLISAGDTDNETQEQGN